MSSTLTESPEVATSDEQYRLIKMVEGSNGFTYQDGQDEEIDDGEDENATLIELTFIKNLLI